MFDQIFQQRSDTKNHSATAPFVTLTEDIGNLVEFIFEVPYSTLKKFQLIVFRLSTVFCAGIHSAKVIRRHP